MCVTICSIFRNSAPYIGRYFEQITELREYMNVRVLATWGDCDDNTYELLRKQPDVEIAAYHHGGPHFGSVDHGPRWDQISKVVRATLDRVGDPGEALIWVESDLLWTPTVMLQLLADLGKVPAVAPMCLASDNVNRFYDTWGYRKGGTRFAGLPPYHNDEEPVDLVKIDSCGSCWVVRGDRTDLWKEWSGHWPFDACDELWLDQTVAVRHP